MSPAEVNLILAVISKLQELMGEGFLEVIRQLGIMWLSLLIFITSIAILQIIINGLAQSRIETKLDKLLKDKEEDNG